MPILAGFHSLYMNFTVIPIPPIPPNYITYWFIVVYGSAVLHNYHTHIRPTSHPSFFSFPYMLVLYIFVLFLFMHFSIHVNVPSL